MNKARPCAGQHHGITIPSYLEDRMQRNLDWCSSFVVSGE